jgi:hypothetical protein
VAVLGRPYTSPLWSLEPYKLDLMLSLVISISAVHPYNRLTTEASEHDCPFCRVCPKRAKPG